MKKQTLMLPLAEVDLEAGESDGTWTVKGYATKFGNQNAYGFSIAEGAYTDLIAKGVTPVIFLNHDSRAVPLGRWTKLEEDKRGLKVEGELTKGVSMASDVYAALKAGTLTGLSVSIAWDPKDELYDDKGRMSVSKVSTLDEISICTFPADGKARISQVLSADEVDDRIESISTVRDLEDFLRDAANLSKRQSGWLIAKAKTCMASETRRDGELKALSELQGIFGRMAD
ncbi:MAG: HK97 family phage prohead protease [Sutterella sp.]|nr:HK97 family phage prohead protease [Sutterella sp.]